MNILGAAENPSKRSSTKKSDRLVKLEAQLEEAFSLLKGMGVSKRGARHPGRLVSPLSLSNTIYLGSAKG